MQLLFVLAIILLGVAFAYAMAVREMLKATSEIMTAKEIVARLEGELAVLAALRARRKAGEITSSLRFGKTALTPTTVSLRQAH